MIAEKKKAQSPLTNSSSFTVYSVYILVKSCNVSINIVHGSILYWSKGVHSLHINSSKDISLEMQYRCNS